MALGVYVGSRLKGPDVGFSIRFVSCFFRPVDFRASCLNAEVIGVSPNCQQSNRKAQGKMGTFRNPAHPDGGSKRQDIRTM